jgi:hypothetical protein
MLESLKTAVCSHKMGHFNSILLNSWYSMLKKQKNAHFEPKDSHFYSFKFLTINPVFSDSKAPNKKNSFQ